MGFHEDPESGQHYLWSVDDCVWNIVLSAYVDTRNNISDDIQPLAIDTGISWSGASDFQSESRGGRF